MVDICWIDFTEPLSNFIGRVIFRHISGFREREREREHLTHIYKLICELKTVLRNMNHIGPSNHVDYNGYQFQACSPISLKHLSF